MFRINAPLHFLGFSKLFWLVSMFANKYKHEKNCHHRYTKCLLVSLKMILAQQNGIFTMSLLF